MLDKEKIELLSKIPKETEIHELLYDLLKEMDYKNVQVTHENGNVPEYGKDLIAAREDEIENNLEWTAFVVKKGNITGTSQMNAEIKAQISECFDYPFESLKYGNISISKVKVVINGKITSGAKQKFFKDDYYKNPNVSFWTQDELLKFIDDKYQRFWLKGSRQYKHYIDLFQQKNKHDDFTKTLAITDDKIEKLLKNTIKQKLIEFYYHEQTGTFKRKWFEVEDLNKISDCKLIVGESGSGKTTLFKQIANNIIYENSIRNDYEFYPILIKFTDLKVSDFKVKNSIFSYFDNENFRDLNFNINNLLDKGNYILFIDALDELGNKNDKNKALKAVNQFHEENPNIQIICSSRNSDSLLGTCRDLDFKYFEINGISIQQAETFLGRFFDDNESKCKRLVKSLKDSRILDKLPKTPLTLTLLTSLFDENGYEIPATITDLYRYFVDILLNKNVKTDHLDLLKVGVHRSVLSFIAEHLHTNKIKSIEKSKLTKLITQFASERGHSYNVNDLIDDLTQNINLLVENDRGEFEFKHLSFQEYFTAYQFYNHNINGKSNFINNFNDIWWQNVAIFFAGMTKDSPELIDDIIENSKPNGFQEYLINVSGLGYLTQALYNTPVNSRIKATNKNIENISKALDFIINTEDDSFFEVKSFLHTTYGAHKILSYWFEFHHTSVTLKEPLSIVYNEMISKLKETEFDSLDEKKDYEYSTYLIASTLIEIEFDNFEKLHTLINLVEKDNYYVLGLIESDFNSKQKTLSKEEKKRKSVKKFEKRLSFIDGEKVNDNVNISIKDGTKIKKLRRFKK